ncbi:MAG: carbohydrate kinase family protein [Candidatus Methanomethylicia archaeon]
MYDVTTVNDLILDIILELPKPLKPESALIPLRIERQPGGSSNFLIMASRLGLKVKAVGCVGNDISGDTIRNALVKENIDVESVIVKKGLTKACLVLTYKGRKSFISLFDRETVFLKPEDIREDMFNTRALYFSGYSLARISSRYENEAVYKAFRICRDRGIDIFFDVSPLVNLIPVEEIKEILESIKICFLNINELKLIEKHIGKPIEKLKSEGILVVKMGERGAQVHYNDKIIEEGTIARKPIDTTGAGDVFNAGFIYGFMRKKDIKYSLKLANIIGALKVEKLGGGLNLPSREEIKKFISLE